MNTARYCSRSRKLRRRRRVHFFNRLDNLSYDFMIKEEFEDSKRFNPGEFLILDRTTNG